MKQKNYLPLLFTGIGLFIVSIILTVALVVPAIKMNALFKLITTGTDDSVAAASVIEATLKGGQKEKAVRLAGDYVAYNVNTYKAGADDEYSFENVAERIAAVYSTTAWTTQDFEDVAGDGFTDFMVVALPKKYCEAANMYELNGSVDDFYSCFTDYYIMIGDNSKVEDALISVLDKEYNSFNDGKSDYDRLDSYVSAAEYLGGAYPNFYQKALEIDTVLSMIKQYKEDLDTMQGYYDDKEYFDVIDYYNYNVTVDFDNDTTGYGEKIQALKDAAYDAGKTYYPGVVDEYVASGDMDSAKTLINKLSDYYGDDIDTDALMAKLYPAWANAYINFMSDYEANLRAMIGTKDTTSIDLAADVSYDDNIPTDVFLFDFDKDGTPELVLHSANLSYIIGFDGSNVVYTGALAIAKFVEGAVISEPYSLSGDYEGYESVSLVGNVWTVNSYYGASETDKKFIVNGSEASYDDAEALHNSYYDAPDDSRIKDSYYTSVGDYEDYIYNFAKQ